MTVSVAFVGLGVMGHPMAGHLARAGYRVRVFNRTAARAAAWADEFGGTACGSPAEAAAGCGFVMTCVGDDDDLREVTVGTEGIFEGIEPDAVCIDHTTTSAAVAEELSAVLAGRGGSYLDAPVSGGQAGAEQGRLTIMIGGDTDAVRRAEPVLNSYGETIRRVGPVGCGQRAKMVNQICIAGIVQGLAEALHFATATGLDAGEVIGAISRGAAQSWQMDNRWESMMAGEFDFGFAVDLMRKDLAIVLDEARRCGARLPVTALVDQFYADVQRMGGNRWDTSSLIARLQSATVRSPRPAR
ncbi:MAG: NAD(P)-dependent oxidoreductase [Gammaproteobacteria bacterium]